jgi:hypothetical protein
MDWAVRAAVLASSVIRSRVGSPQAANVCHLGAAAQIRLLALRGPGAQRQVGELQRERRPLRGAQLPTQ